MASRNRCGRMAGVGSLLLALLGLAAIARADAGPGAAPYVWIEAEQPTTTNANNNQKARGHIDWLSGGKWLCYAFGAADAAKNVQGDAINISYAFTAPADGKYTVWNRVALDSIRSPFSW